MLIEFVIQNQFFSYTLEEFAQILDIPSEGACVFTDKWSLYELAYGVPRDGPYQTNPPSPDDIISYVQNDREGQVTRTRHRQKINVQDYQILTREIVSTLKPLEVSGGESPELVNESYVLYDRVMNPLTTQQEQKTRKDCGTRRGHHSTSSSSAFDQPSFSHLNDDDDDENDEGTSRASTHSPIRFVNSLTNESSLSLFLSSSSSSNSPTMDSTQASSSNPSKKIKLTIILPKQLFVNISSDEDVTTTSSPITTSSSPPPNTPSKTPSTKDTSSIFGTTSSSFESKPQSSPPTSNNTPSPQPSNPFLKNVMDAPPRPSHPLPLQSYPSLDITLSLSPITPFDHILNTPSPPSPQPQPQPPLMDHPIYFNYHGSTCICCFHNRNLIFSLRDEMNLMFAHIEYLLS
ncbi:hypothetical protein Tco_0500318 [Tanacetum coccineum]